MRPLRTPRLARIDLAIALTFVGELALACAFGVFCAFVAVLA